VEILFTLMVKSVYVQKTVGETLLPIFPRLSRKNADSLTTIDKQSSVESAV